MFLYEKMNTVKEFGDMLELPYYLIDGLSKRIEIREYQKEAFENFITYYENKNLRKNKQIHVLFHMATGSGKTLIMAGLILYLYKQGYRNFLFFVNLKNVVEKTKDNFLNKSSNKYLFNQSIQIDGEDIEIKQVDNFQNVNEDNINIVFSTTQKLHNDITTPKENSITMADFEDKKMVLISDESHHVNTETKKSKSRKQDDDSWEYSVNRVFASNKDNVLLEFTATCDLKDPNVLSKYIDKIIFDYPLAKFRESKYTKDFKNMQSDYDKWQRTLNAMILSQYRLKLFADIKQNIKPVILLKSQKIADSEAFYKEFFNKLSALNGDEIAKMNTGNNDIMNSCFEYMHKKGITDDMLAEELKMDFSEEHCIIMNGDRDNTVEKQLAINSLEDSNNPYRLIFTVDMLNEGWDVLNLFDIVRLYETRQGGKKTSTYTIKEAQLIGRAARYCPFKNEYWQDKYKRKYDDDVNNEMRICETMYYHSKENSRYITELRKALREYGLLSDNRVEVVYKLKDQFKSEEYYKNGYIFSNKKNEKDRNDVCQIDGKIRNLSIDFKSEMGNAIVYDLFEENQVMYKKETFKSSIYLKDVSFYIVFSAINKFQGLKFNILKSHFPNLKSTREFVTSDNYLGNCTLNIITNSKNVLEKELYFACIELFKKIEQFVGNIKKEFFGTPQFEARYIHDIIKDKVRYIENPHGDGEGISQNQVSSDMKLDLSKEEWYVFVDNFGTTEEKKFVYYFSNIVEKFKQKYDKVFLIRNERFPELAIYDFDSGERFEPDYLLVLQKNGVDGYEQQQIFIEPKGTGFIKNDIWKEEFLIKLEEKSIPITKYVDDNKYKIIGIPFFNADTTDGRFESAMRDLLK